MISQSIIKELQEIAALDELRAKKLHSIMSKLGSGSKPSPALKNKATIQADVQRRINRRVNKNKQ